jgi:hypothetical protein
MGTDRRKTCSTSENRKEQNGVFLAKLLAKLY